MEALLTTVPTSRLGVCVLLREVATHISNMDSLREIQGLAKVIAGLEAGVMRHGIDLRFKTFLEDARAVAECYRQLQQLCGCADCKCGPIIRSAEYASLGIGSLLQVRLSATGTIH